MRWLAPLALLAAALAALLLTPAERPLLGLSHDDFGRAALGASMLVWLLMSGLVRAGPAGAARVLTNAALWAAITFALIAIYAYRFEFSEIADRVMHELRPGDAKIGPSGDVVIRRRGGSEFIIPAKINGRPISLIFDTGASSVVLSAEDAAAVGVSVGDEDFDVDVTTANGSTTAASARIDSVAVGNIVVRGVRALVARRGTLRQSLLGMSFLERLRAYGVENGRLVLRGK